MAKELESLVGKTFGQLYVIERDFSRVGTFYFCRCSCDTIVSVASFNLRHHKNKSCGKHKGSRNPRWKGCGEISGKMWGGIKNDSQRRGWHSPTRLRKDCTKKEFSISIEYAWDLFLKQERKCALSGVTIYFDDGTNTHSRTASLDRVDSSKGYIEGNVQWVHKTVNKMKQWINQDEFIKFCLLIDEYNKDNLNECA